MNQETARWYLELLANPELAQEKYSLSPEELLEILKNGLGAEDLADTKAILEQIYQGLFAQNLPDQEILEYWEKGLKERERQRKKITKEAVTEIRLNIEALKKRQLAAEKLKDVLRQNVKGFGEAPEETKNAVVLKFTEIIQAQLPAEPKELTPQFNQVLADAGFSAPPASVLEETISWTKAAAEARTATVPLVEPEVKPVEETFLAPEVEGVAFVPVYTVLNPPVAASLVQKVVLAPVVKTLQFMDIVAGEELQGKEVSTWREILHKGLNSKDLDASIKALAETGVSPEHPQIKALEAKKEEVLKWERAHPRQAFIFEHYHEYSKLTGRREIPLKEIGISLPRHSPEPQWANRGYPSKVRNVLNEIGVRLALYEKTTLPTGKILIRFSLPDKLIRFGTFGRVQSFSTARSWVGRKTLSPILNRLGKTGFGMAVKKGAAGIIAKLGLAAIPTGVTQVAAVALLVKDFLPLVKGLFRKLWNNPLLFSLVVLGGTLALILPFIVSLLPILVPVVLIAGGLSLAFGLLLGAKGFIGAVFSGIGNLVGAAAGGLSGFLTSLGALTIPSFFPLAIVGGTIIGVGSITAFNTLNTSAAFRAQGGRGEPVNYGQPVNPRPPGEAGHLAEAVVYTLNQCGISQITKASWSQVGSCLNSSNLPGKEKIIAQFKYSVDSFYTLQCVGFVRGVMDALGLDPGNPGGQKAGARDYLYEPYPSNYYPANRNIQEVAVGDLVIMEGQTYGHITIVVKREEREGTVFITVAEALGETGLIRVAETKAYVFDGFLRPR